MKLLVGRAVTNAKEKKVRGQSPTATSSPASDAYDIASVRLPTVTFS